MSISPESTQTMFAGTVSAVFVLAVHRLGRNHRLSFRYTVGWMALGVMGVFGGFLVPAAEPLATLIYVSPGVLVGLFALILLLILCVQLSISISGLQEQVRTLGEESAFLRNLVDQMKSGRSQND